MTSYSALHGRRVLTVDDARDLGRVSQLMIDPDACTVSAMQLDGTPGPSLLRWPNIRSLGPDAVMVQSADALDEPADEERDDLRHGRHQLDGKSVYDSSGDLIGRFEDLELDDQSARVTGITAEGQSVTVGEIVVGPAAVIVRLGPADRDSYSGDS